MPPNAAPVPKITVVFTFISSARWTLNRDEKKARWLTLLPSRVLENDDVFVCFFPELLDLAWGVFWLALGKWAVCHPGISVRVCEDDLFKRVGTQSLCISAAWTTHAAADSRPSAQLFPATSAVIWCPAGTMPVDWYFSAKCQHTIINEWFFSQNGAR